MMTVPQALELAVQHHQAGRLSEAENLYRRVLLADPQNADALHLLGVIASQVGRPEMAVDLIRQALSLKPALGAAYINLGNAHQELHQHAEAADVFRRALQLQPDFAEAYNNLGFTLKEQGKPEEAIAAFRRAIHFKPDFVEAYDNLGTVLKREGKINEAIAAYRQEVECAPNHFQGHINLGDALGEQCQFDKAIAAYQRAVELRPDHARARNNLGNLLESGGRFAEAEAAYRRGMELDPDFPLLHNNLANILKDQGCLDEAIAQFRHALLLAPDDAAVHSNLIYTLHFHPGRDAKTMDDEQRRWNERFSEPLRRFVQAPANDHDPNRRLRVGYVSPDFWSHVICYFFTPLLEAHDRSQFEIFCYASVKRPDAITGRIKKSADVWRDVRGLGDEALAALIRQDGIDLLVDLTLHMADNRLLMLARKPAPVQVTWLGYPGSSGLPTMDWRLTDARMDPEGAPWSESPDQPFRLPDTACCFAPIEEYPPVNELPALHEGHVTFGCLNNFCKTNEAVLRLWAEVLAAVPRSRLLLRCPQGSAQTRVRAFFAAQGIAANRLDLIAWTARRAEFFRLLGSMAIALDPFPYNGGTTTCESLWMGVPVLTLPGTQPAARQGLSLLTAAGLGEFAAADQADFLSRAVRLAADLPRLAQLRAMLRERLQASPLMDAPRFTHNIEAAYRAMWRQWCTKETAE